MTKKRKHRIMVEVTLDIPVTPAQAKTALYDAIRYARSKTRSFGVYALEIENAVCKEGERVIRAEIKKEWQRQEKVDAMIRNFKRAPVSKDNDTVIRLSDGAKYIVRHIYKQGCYVLRESAGREKNYSPSIKELLRHELIEIRGGNRAMLTHKGTLFHNYGGADAD